MENYYSFYSKHIEGLTQRSGAQYSGHCPFTENHSNGRDNKPSFEVNIDTGQYICHACNEKGNQKTFRAKLNIFDKPKPKRKIEAVFDYNDENGKLLFQVVRFEPKDFLQRRHDGKEWIYKTNDIKKVPYRLPELIKSNDWVFIPEGEKHVDKLIELGFSASCNVGGACNWTKKNEIDNPYNPYFKDRKVCLLPDNDIPGKKHAEQVGRSLQGIAKEIKILNLPLLPEKGDIIDFIAMEYQKGLDTQKLKDKICDLLKTAPIWCRDETISTKDDVIEEIEEIDLNFPHEIMEGLAGDFSLVYSEHLEGAKEFFYISFLTALGSLIADKVTLDSELYPQPRLYTLIIGQSADARKSTAIEKTIEFFKEKSWPPYKTVRGVGSAEGLVKLLKDEEPTLLYFDEFKSFVSKCKIDSSVLLPMCCTLFESNHYHTHTKKSSIALDSAYISIIGASTIATYERMWTENFLSIGFLNRVFILPGDTTRKFSIPPPIDKKLKNSLGEGLRDILRLIEHNENQSGKFIIPINIDAWETYDKWYLALDRSEYSKRLDTYALKFMILLALNVQKSSIDVDVIEKVIKLMDWQYRVRRAYAPIDAENSMAKMEQDIRKKLLSGGLKDWELKRLTNANRSGIWIYNNAIKNLLNSKEIIKSNKKWWLIKEK